VGVPLEVPHLQESTKAVVKRKESVIKQFVKRLLKELKELKKLEELKELEDVNNIS